MGTSYTIEALITSLFERYKSKQARRIIMLQPSPQRRTFTQRASSCGEKVDRIELELEEARSRRRTAIEHVSSPVDIACEFHICALDRALPASEVVCAFEQMRVVSSSSRLLWMYRLRSTSVGVEACRRSRVEQIGPILLFPDLTWLIFPVCDGKSAIR
jgi:hypothetical protein